MLRRLSLIVLLLLAASLLLAACGDDEDGSDAETGATAGEEGAVSCEEVEAPGAKQVDLPKPKAERPQVEKVVFETSCGSFTVELDAKRAPKTAASFEYLAEEGVYDGTGFHRVAPGFVIQGGDPAGDGTGGPGFSVDERPPRDLAYTQRTVAMAKTGAEPPGRSGSQFFIVTAPDAGLPPDFALVGEVSEGFDVVQAIEALGTPGGDGPPSMPVVIETATVE